MFCLFSAQEGNLRKSQKRSTLVCLTPKAGSFIFLPRNRHKSTLDTAADSITPTSQECPGLPHHIVHAYVTFALLLVSLNPGFNLKPEA